MAHHSSSAPDSPDNHSEHTNDEGGVFEQCASALGGMAARGLTYTAMVAAPIVSVYGLGFKVAYKAIAESGLSETHFAAAEWGGIGAMVATCSVIGYAAHELYTRKNKAITRLLDNAQHIGADIGGRVGRMLDSGTAVAQETDEDNNVQPSKRDSMHTPM